MGLYLLTGKTVTGGVEIVSCSCARRVQDGTNKRVGSPLAKDFIHKIEQGILKSSTDSDAETILKFGNMCSYWKNNMKRIW